MPSELDKLKDICKALGVGTVGCRTMAQHRAALDAQAPGWRAETPQQPSNVIAQARARAASSGPVAPSRHSLAQQSRAAAWTRREEDDLLVAFEDGKTGQELADAVGGGRIRDECEEKLKRLTPPVLVAYDWDENDPRKHTAKIRALLPAAQQNLSAPELTKLWKKESPSFRKDAITRVVNVNLPHFTLDDTAKILVEMGLPPSAFRMKSKPPLRSTKLFQRHAKSFRTLMTNVRRNRKNREAMLEGNPVRSPYAKLNADGTRMDMAYYSEMRTKGCLLVCIGLGACLETEMPTEPDFPEIVSWTKWPPFERLALPRTKTSFAEASYARQFCFICDSLFVLKGGRVFVEHCKVRLHKRGVHGFCSMCNTGIFFLADVIRAAVAKAGLRRSVALNAVDKIAEAFKVEDADFDDMFDCD